MGVVKMADLEENDFGKTMVLAPSEFGGEKVVPKAKLICANVDLLGDSAGAEVILDGKDVCLGRGDENTVALKVEGISRLHARFFPSGDMWGVVDLGSTNGVKVNGSKAHEAFLKHGDMVQIGKLQYQFLVEGKAPPVPKAAKPDADITGAGEKTAIIGKQQAATAAQAPAGRPTGTKAIAEDPAKSGPNVGLLLISAGVILMLVVGALAFLQ